MKTIISVYDVKAGLFTPPFYTNTKGEAVRSFSDEVNNPQGQIGKHPEDYDLYCFGTFDEQDAIFVLYPEPERIAHAGDFVKE